jgi:hypothetical protein
MVEQDTQLNCSVDFNECKNKWSFELEIQTREAIDRCYCALDGNLHLKNKNNSFGYIHWTDLMQLKILVRIKNENPSTAKFNDVSALIDAGWVVD